MGSRHLGDFGRPIEGGTVTPRPWTRFRGQRSLDDGIGGLLQAIRIQPRPLLWKASDIETSCRQGGGLNTTCVRQLVTNGISGSKEIVFFLLAVDVHNRSSADQPAFAGQADRTQIRSEPGGLSVAPRRRAARPRLVSQHTPRQPGPGRWHHLWCRPRKPGLERLSEGLPPGGDHHGSSGPLGCREATGFVETGAEVASLVRIKPARGPTQGLVVVVVTTHGNGEWGWGAAPAAHPGRGGHVARR